MSSILEMLAKLTAKTCSLTPLGGKSDTTWEDVVASMPKASRHAHLYIYAKYCCDEDAELLKVAKQKARRKFKGLKMSEVQIDTLAAIALGEALCPGHCKACNGAGQIQTKKGVIVCAACEGTGRGKSISDRQLASSLGVSAKMVKQCWRASLNELLADYQEYETTAEEALKKGLRTKEAVL